MVKLLLVGVFKPYGVDSEYGEALNTMELLNNQVTREQGIHSPRSNNPSFGLYMLAENIDVQTTVLDFPSWKAFTKEIDGGNYTHVGISFITPNVMKAKRMAEYVRANSPDTKIIVGGHGAGIPSLDKLIDYDEICRGEGIAWLRRYFGEDIDRPLEHPVVYSAVRKNIYGAPIIDNAGIVVPGVGCQNSCRFCATSHKFEKQYTPFLKTGKEVFDACEKTEKALKVFDFGLMDENFCKSPVRAKQLLAEMEKNGKAYTFSTFSSAEVVTKIGVDFLTRLGVNFLWIGVESKWDVFEKTHGIDLPTLIKDLQEHGITVLASAILFMEHHDKTTIHEDIDWAIGLESDLLQFMQFGPIPGTKLYKDYEAEGKLLMDIPWPRQHGQDEIWFHHPHFTLPESASYIKEAFIKKYETHGPGVINMAHTSVRGYLTQVKEVKERKEQGLVWNPKANKYEKSDNPKPDKFMKLRINKSITNALRFRPILTSALKYAPNEAAREKARMVIDLYNETFGKITFLQKIQETVVRASAVIENYRYKKNDIVMRQPATNRQTWPDRSGNLRPATIGIVKEAKEIKEAVAAGAYRISES